MTEQPTGERRARRARAGPAHPLADKPFRQTRNPFAPLEPLSAEQLHQIDDASLRILEQIGIDFLDGEALDLWAAAGAEVDHAAQHVCIDRALLRELVGRAPASFVLRARNPER